MCLDRRLETSERRNRNVTLPAVVHLKSLRRGHWALTTALSEKFPPRPVFKRDRKTVARTSLFKISLIIRSAFKFPFYFVSMPFQARVLGTAEWSTRSTLLVCERRAAPSACILFHRALLSSILLKISQTPTIK
jgi:hypothetical protein